MCLVAVVVDHVIIGMYGCVLGGSLIVCNTWGAITELGVTLIVTLCLYTTRRLIDLQTLVCAFRNNIGRRRGIVYSYVNEPASNGQGEALP